MKNRQELKLREVISIVKDMRNKLDNSSYIIDLSSEVEELEMTLDLDITFDTNEIKLLKKAKFSFTDDNTCGTKIYKGSRIWVEKYGYFQYYLRFEKGKSRKYTSETDDIYDITNSNSKFFQELYKRYEKDMKKS